MAKKRKSLEGILIDPRLPGDKHLRVAYFLGCGICDNLITFGKQLPVLEGEVIFEDEDIEALSYLINREIDSGQDSDYILLFDVDLSLSNYKLITKNFPYPVADISILLYNYLMSTKKNDAYSLLLMKFYDILEERDRLRHLKRIPQKELKVDFEQSSDVNDQIKEVFSKREKKFQKALDSGLPIISVLGAGATSKHIVSYLLTHFEFPLEETYFRHEFDSRLSLINNYQYPSFYLHNALPFTTNECKYYDQCFAPMYEEMGYASLYIVVVDAFQEDYDERLKKYDNYIKSIAKRKDYKIIHLLDEDEFAPSQLSRLPRVNEYITDIGDSLDKEEVLSFIFESIYEDWKEVTLLLPYEIDINAFRKENYVKSVEETKNGHLITCRLNPLNQDKYKDYLL
ncbi:MAG: hypothetical protein LUD22_00650 [Coprobacillus sp.]|nr:hypothetical protein [Coprobacillus sp.]